MKYYFFLLIQYIKDLIICKKDLIIIKKKYISSSGVRMRKFLQKYKGDDNYNVDDDDVGNGKDNNNNVDA